MAKVLDRIMEGARTPGGKAVALLLTLCLSLMTWNAATIEYAFADEGDAIESPAEENTDDVVVEDTVENVAVDETNDTEAPTPDLVIQAESTDDETLGNESDGEQPGEGAGAGDQGSNDGSSETTDDSSKDKAIRVTAASATKVYDGTPLTSGDVTVTGLPEGYTYKATTTGSVTDVQYNEAGQVVGVENAVQYFTIVDDYGMDVTQYFEENVVRESGMLTVTPRPVTITTGSDSKVYDGTPLTNSEVSINDLANGETVALVATGSQTEVGSSYNTYTITWAAGGNSYTAKADNYTVTENPGTLTVTSASPNEVVITAASAEKTYDGTPLTANTVTATGLPEGYKVVATASGSITNVCYEEVQEGSDTAYDGEDGSTFLGTVGSVPNEVDEGWQIVNNLGADVTSEFINNVTVVNGTLTINPAPLTITTGAASKEYDGAPLTNEEASIEGLVNGETATVAAIGSQTDVGTTENAHSITWGESVIPGNYAIEENLGLLTVAPNTSREITLTAGSAAKTYDGAPLTNSAVTVTGLPEGFTYEATASGSQTDAGESSNKVTSYVFYDASGNDVTSSFANVKLVDGGLVVAPVLITVTTGSATKSYDGRPLTNSDATLTGLVNGETATIVATGSQTEPGTSTNTYRIYWGDTNSGNYYIDEESFETLGTLTVTPFDTEITLTAASASRPYDGTPLTANTVTATGLPDGFKVVATASGSQTEAGSCANVVNDGYIIRDHNGEDRTSRFTNVKKVDGTLTVEKATLTVITESKTAVYDGTTLAASGRVTGLANGENVTFAVTGAQKDVGSSINTYTLAFAGEEGADASATAKRSNYTVNEQLGRLTVTEYANEVVVITSGGTFVYDGKPHTAIVDVSLPNGYTVEKAISNTTVTDVTSESVPVTCDELVIKNSAGEDVTNQLSITKVDDTIVVTPAALTITTPSATKEYDGTPLTAQGTIAGLMNGEKAAFTTVGSITDPGTARNAYTIAFMGEEGADATTTAKRSNYTIVEGAIGTLVVNQNDDVVLTAATASKTYDGKPLETNKVIATGLPEGFTTSAFAVGSQTNVGISNNVVAESFIIYDADGRDKTANFTSVNRVNGTLTVAPSELTITSGSATKPYDGTPLTCSEYTAEGLAEGETLDITFTGSQTEYGYSPNTCTLAWNGTAAESNYTLKAVNFGTLTVTTNNVEIVLTASSATKTYDGIPLASSGATASGLPAGFTVEGSTASGSQTDAGSSANVVNDGYVIKNAAGEDKTWNFTNVKKANGTLTVTPRPVTLTSASGEKVYDGTPLVKNEQTDVTVSGDGFVLGQGATYDITGSQTWVGSSANTFTYSLNEGTKAANYDITTVPGTLTVTPSSDAVQVVITENSGTATYNGSEQAVTGYTVTSISDPNYTASDFTFIGDDTAKGADVGTYNMELKASDFQNTNPNYGNVEFIIVDGTLTIGKRSVTLASATDSKPYDGTALTNATVTVGGDGWASGEGATYNVTGSQTLVGSSANAFTYTLNEGTKAANYDITTTAGTLTVTNRDALYEITVVANSATATYDGASHSVSGFETLSFTVNGAAYTVSGLNASGADGTNAGTYANNVTGTATVRDASGNDVTNQFAVHVENGQLEVAKRSVILTSADAEKVYDGAALADSTVTVGGDGWASGEGATYNVTGSQTLVGSSANAFTYTLNVGTNAANYDISKVEGILEVTDGAEGASVDDGLVVTMSDTRSEGYEYKLGETVTYSVTVTNIYDAEKPLAVSGDGMTVVDALATIPAGSSVTFTVTKVITEGDILAAESSQGVLGSTLSVALGDLSATGSDSVKVSAATASYTVAMSADKTSDLHVGDAVTYTVEVANTGNVTLSNIAIDDVMGNGASVKWAAGTPLVGGNPVIASLAPNGTATLVGTYTITQADVDAQRTIVNTVSSTASDPSGRQVNPGGTVSARVTTVEKDAAVAVSMGTVGAVPEGGYALGDTIVFEVTVTNTGNVTVSDIAASDDLTGANWSITSLEPGASRTFTTSYTVMEEDILAGSVANGASATGSDLQGYEVAGDDAASVATAPKASHITVSSAATSKPTHSNAYVAGETVEYAITVVNDGNTTVSNVTVSDMLTGRTWTIDSLAPGESTVLTASYVVSDADVEGGGVWSAVTVAGTDSEGQRASVTPGTIDIHTQPLYGLTVEYAYSTDLGNPFNTYTEYYAAGETYTVTPAAVAGYTANASRLSASMPAQDTTVQVIYTENPPAADGGAFDGGAAGGTAAGGTGGAAAGGAGDAAIAAAGTVAALAVTSIANSVNSVAIDDGSNPLVEAIDDDANALASGASGAWSPFDLACTVVTALLALLMLAGLLNRKREDDDGSEGGSSPILRVAGLIPAVAAIALFVLTQDMSQPIVIVDVWSIPFALLASVNVLLMAILALRGSDDGGTRRFAQSSA